MLHRGGKHDLRAGTAKLLQMVDKGIQLLRGAKQHFNQHAVIASHAVALHNIAAALDVGVKLRLELGVHIQVDERLDQLPQLERGNLRLIAGQYAIFFQFGNAGRNRRGGQKHPVGNFFQRGACVCLQNINDFAVNAVHTIHLRYK